jgi:hypothetical protein
LPKKTQESIIKNMSSIKNIIFIVESPFLKRDYERFGIELLRKNGFDVNVWELTPFLNPHRSKTFSSLDKCDFGNSRVFLRRQEFVLAISQLSSDCFFILAIGYSFKSAFVFIEISRRSLPYSFLEYHLPCFDFQPKRNRSKLLRRVFSSELLLYLFLKIPHYLFGIKPAKLKLMVCGETNLITKYPSDKTTDIIKAHYFDYDIYLNEIREPVQLDEKLGVFLDNCLPFHPDWKSSSQLDPAIYYPLLCRFFDLLEKEYGMHIVIAAHPRSSYENMKGYYGDRPVIRGKTVNLVRKSKLVISHQSASTSYAILFNKPIVFVTTDCLRQYDDLGPLTEFIAAALNKRVHNLSGNFKFDPKREFVVDTVAYKRFKNKYIKEEGTEDLPTWQIFANYLKR